MAIEVAERFCGGGKLCVLRLVGLAFSAAHRVYILLFVGKRFAYRKSKDQEGGENMDNAQHCA